MLKCKYFTKDGLCSKFDPEKYNTPKVAFTPLICQFNGDAEKCFDYALKVAFKVKTQMEIDEFEYTKRLKIDLVDYAKMLKKNYKNTEISKYISSFPKEKTSKTKTDVGLARCKHLDEEYGICMLARDTPIPYPFVKNLTAGMKNNVAVYPIWCPHHGDVQECLESFIRYSIDNFNDWASWIVHIVERDGVMSGKPMVFAGDMGKWYKKFARERFGKTGDS
jgi:hypothetical protein